MLSFEFNLLSLVKTEAFEIICKLQQLFGWLYLLYRLGNPGTCVIDVIAFHSHTLERVGVLVCIVDRLNHMSISGMI